MLLMARLDWIFGQSSSACTMVSGALGELFHRESWVSKSLRSPVPQSIHHIYQDQNREQCNEDRHRRHVTPLCCARCPKLLHTQPMTRGKRESFLRRSDSRLAHSALGSRVHFSVDQRTPDSPEHSE